MNTRTLSIIGLVLLGAILFLGGMFFGWAQASATAFFPGSMMFTDDPEAQAYGYNMMGNNASMMNASFDMMGSGAAFGMMGAVGDLANVKPLSIEDAEKAIDNYLASLNDGALTLGEIMIFDNHAYAQILDKVTGEGAFEVLVDPVTGNVYPEPGPNMMWNNEYGHMSGSGSFGMMGSGMMGGFGSTVGTEINVRADEAVDIAQQYLDASLPGTTASDDITAFPGYYTLHFERDGEIGGMLSVNAYNGQVFLHHWHGDFIEISEGAHE